MRRSALALGFLLAVATAAGGCVGTRRLPLASGSVSASDDVPAPNPDGAAPAAPAGAPCPPPCDPCAPLCGLPCEQGIGGWHARVLGGLSMWAGEDPGENCGYLGADLGANLCGSCWSIDGFWRGHTAHFDRDPSGEDGGTWNHVGVKASYERSLGGERWFAWGGAGPEYFWTSDYLHDDRGLGVFGEVGIGYLVSRTFRIRAGIDVHGMSTDAGRASSADDGDSRWLWLVAPTIGLEVDF